MKLGWHIGYWGRSMPQGIPETLVEVERLGFDSAWTAESWGSDAISPLAWWGASTSTIRLGTNLIQLSARTPAATAMTAITLDHMSNGRLCLGIGVSGPQVVEGWYGQPFKRPLERTREWLAIFRKLVAREETVRFEGAQYQLPYRGAGSTQQGKALMSITHPLRQHIPVYLGAEGPKNVELAMTECDGWFPLLMPPDRFDIYGDALALRKPGFEVLQSVSFSLDTNPITGYLPIKKMLALYVGGYGSVAQKIKDLWLGGRQKEAVMAVPDELADALSLIGSRDSLREKLGRWKHSPATTLMIGVADTFEETVNNMEVLAAEAA